MGVRPVSLHQFLLSTNPTMLYFCLPVFICMMVFGFVFAVNAFGFRDRAVKRNRVTRDQGKGNGYFVATTQEAKQAGWTIFAMALGFLILTLVFGLR
jgi:hypothetical protein